MKQPELPLMEWPAFTVFIILVLAFTATLFYIRSITRTGFNDVPPGEESEEDNSLAEAIEWRNQNEFKNQL